MKVLFKETFKNDLKEIGDKKIKNKIKEIILKLEKAEKLTDISGVIFLKGSKNAYRIRIGNYRLGFFYDKNIIYLSRVLPRKDIYKKFP